MAEPLIKVHDVAFPRLRVPDLDRMEKFLVDFGMEVSGRTDTALFMRGAGPAHHVHVSELGEEPGLAGLAFYAKSEADLETLAAAPGASQVHETGEPGGGRRVTLVDPNGYRVEVVHGIEELPPLQTDSMPLNLGGRVERRGSVKRVGKHPARVLRLGHIGVNVLDPVATYEWYHAHFGVLISDKIALGETMLAAFTRCDRGSTLTDHHSFLVAGTFEGEPGLNHCSWEIVDLDDLWLGQEHLTEEGHKHVWGIGRHILGSQLFDYWRDPWGQIHEHFTDGDLLDAAFETGEHTPAGLMSQWGPPMPAGMGRTVAEDEG